MAQASAMGVAAEWALVGAVLLGGYAGAHVLARWLADALCDFLDYRDCQRIARESGRDD
jgi:hypothetical protein